MIFYVLAAFGACLLGVTATVVHGTQFTFQREKTRVVHELRSAAEENAQTFSSDWPSTLSFVASIASEPGIASFNPSTCGDVLSGLEGGVQGASIYALRADGSIICQLEDKSVKGKPLVPGAWLGRALSTGKQVVTDVAVDPRTGAPTIVIASPIVGPDGQVGVLAAEILTATPPLLLPAGMSPHAVLVAVDAHRRIVVATTEKAPIAAGKSVVGTPYAVAMPSKGRTVKDVDGVTRIYTEVHQTVGGWHVLAGLPAAEALKSANGELRRNLELGGLTFLLVAAMGVVLHRRLARPVRRLGKAIEASWKGDTAARAPVAGPAEVAHVATVFNHLISERQAREAELAYQATHDALTGLPNRMSFNDHVDSLLASDERPQLAVAFLDLDRFKHINDAHGHAVGDSLLVALGARLRESLDETCMVARFGGDEFVIAAVGIDGDQEAVLLAGRLAAILQAPFRLGAQVLYLRGSVGIAREVAGSTAEDLVRDADTAMYRAKDRGKGGYALFDREMREWALLRLDTERDLNRALERGEFTLHYQPKVALAGGTAVGAEALLRWRHPDRGLVSPGDFIPVAEETGLIVPIGEWVLHEACRQAVAWRTEHGSLPVAVNLAARQLSLPDLTAVVAAALRETGARPDELVLEITESAVLLDAVATSERLAEVRRMGVRVSIDDFGTGFSSLSYLQRLPIDELKVDRSFVAPLTRDEPSSAIVESIIGLAHAVGLTVVAEGVETPEQLAELERLGCDQAQGYLLARPQASAAVSQFLQARLERGATV